MDTVRLIKSRTLYKTANQRPACKNCGWVEDVFGAASDVPSWRCGRHHFHTTAMAICNMHIAKDAPKPVIDEVENG